MYKIAASIMCAKQTELKSELEKIENAGIEMLHCDVMDGIFVNNLAMGPYVIEEISKKTSIPLDIHLATINPLKYIKMFSSIKPSSISFHIETSENVKKDIEMLRELSISPALAISPETPVRKLLSYLSLVDMILIMTVNPGFSGQNFNYSVLDKMAELKEYLDVMETPPLIEVDGNVNEKTIPLLRKNGANIYVLGTSALFNEKPGSFREKADTLRSILKN